MGGLPTWWSFWQEPMHTIFPGVKASDAKGKLAEFERYLDFYMRVAPALRTARRDDMVVGWQLNAANGHAKSWDKSDYSAAIEAFILREQQSGHEVPLDFFTDQNFRAETQTDMQIYH